MCVAVGGKPSDTSVASARVLKESNTKTLVSKESCVTSNAMNLMLLVMGSVFLGFLFFGGSYAAFMYKKSKALVWSLFTIAILLITLIPVILAVIVSINPH